MIDPFAPTYEAVPEAATQAQPAALSLFELNARVRAMLHHTLPDSRFGAAAEFKIGNNAMIGISVERREYRWGLEG